MNSNEAIKQNFIPYPYDFPAIKFVEINNMKSDIRDRLSQPPWKLELRISKQSYDEECMYDMLKYDNAELIKVEYSSSLEDELDFSIRGVEETYRVAPSLERWHNSGFEILSMTDCGGTEYTKRDCLIKIEGKW